MKIIRIKLLNKQWSIRFLPPYLLREDENGTCYSCKQIIDIDNSMDKNETKHILTHELTHAFLFMCGRAYEHEINNESICEFVACHIEEILKARDKILGELK